MRGPLLLGCLGVFVFFAIVAALAGGSHPSDGAAVTIAWDYHHRVAPELHVGGPTELEITLPASRPALENFGLAMEIDNWADHHVITNSTLPASAMGRS